ncbi:MAG: tetratricopeptide repeat protein [Candidatus Riflebacteria bacterium]|nr:tetratricopeptide repeat protein [Candidatus Riflebacteria bacterium]
MLMELNQENLAVICVTELGVIKGRIRVPVDESMPDGSHASGPGDGGGTVFLHLVDVTVFDHQKRILKRVPRLALNRRYIVYFVEDEMALELDRVKAMISGDDYEGALAELERLLSVMPREGELLYLAGVTYHRSGQEDKARDCFRRALELTLDEKLAGVIRRHLERE